MIKNWICSAVLVREQCICLNFYHNMLSKVLFVCVGRCTQICGQKRPWYDLKVNTSKLMHSESLDLNAPAGEIEVAQGGCAVQGHESPVRVHHTLGITRYSYNHLML